jgi:hypothetical protein
MDLVAGEDMAPLLERLVARASDREWSRARRGIRYEHPRRDAVQGIPSSDVLSPASFSLSRSLLPLSPLLLRVSGLIALACSATEAVLFERTTLLPRPPLQTTPLDKPRTT